MPTNLSLPQKHRKSSEVALADRPASLNSSLRRRWPGLGARLLAWLNPGRQSRARRPAKPQASESNGQAAPLANEHGGKDSGMPRRLIAQDRYGFVLLKEAIGQITEGDAQTAWQALNAQMALIPAGSVPLMLCDGSFAISELEAFYLDRYAVTNRQFQRFVQSGAYDDLQIWPPEVWPSVARLTDLSGRPGPRDWENGKFPAVKAEHPVVGVCWYEALAYRAGWANGCRPPRNGKRPAAGPSNSAAEPAIATPGATCSSRHAPTSRHLAWARQPACVNTPREQRPTESTR